MRKKSPDAFRTISEVAEVLDIPAHVLRFWESRFSQIKPVKRGGGRRYYRPQDIDLLRGIRDLLYKEGLTIKGVQKILRQQGVKHVAEIGHLQPAQDPIVIGEAEEETAPVPPPPRKPREEPPEPPMTAKDKTSESDPEPETEPEPVPEPDLMPVAEPVDTAAPAEAAPPQESPVAASIDGLHIPKPSTAPEPDAPIDLFAHAEGQHRRPFPPDPARAARKEELRSLIGKLEKLRDKMAASR